eukprot:GHVL01003513.1.p1 GENE.GHVL01003513.1~~GHVL01003513.1.p1  ORF type:complete len:299 (+),score=16.98 GHVL01003513.1:33-899(+)
MDQFTQPQNIWKCDPYRQIARNTSVTPLNGLVFFGEPTDKRPAGFPIRSRNWSSGRRTLTSKDTKRYSDLAGRPTEEPSTIEVHIDKFSSSRGASSKNGKNVPATFSTSSKMLKKSGQFAPSHSGMMEIIAHSSNLNYFKPAEPARGRSRLHYNEQQYSNASSNCLTRNRSKAKVVSFCEGSSLSASCVPLNMEIAKKRIMRHPGPNRLAPILAHSFNLPTESGVKMTLYTDIPSNRKKISMRDTRNEFNKLSESVRANSSDRCFGKVLSTRNRSSFHIWESLTMENH